MTTTTDPRPDGALRGTILGVAVLAAVLGAGMAVALAVGGLHPSRGRAVAFAATVTGVGAISGWVVARRAVTNPASRGGGALAATALRMGPGLAALAWLGTRGGPLREAGAGGLLVAFYLALLASTILLHMMWDPSASAPRSTNHR